MQWGTESGQQEAGQENWQRFCMGPVPHVFQTMQTPTGLAWWLAAGWWEVEVELNVLVHFHCGALFGNCTNCTSTLFVKFQQDWHGGLEREAPEGGAILFAPSVKDAVAIRMDDQDSMLGENNLAAKIGKRAQADEGMGGGGRNMPLHSRWWEGWGRG